MLGSHRSPALAQRSLPRPTAVESRDWLRSLFDEHFPYVWRLVRRLGVHEVAADDVTQQVFVLIAARLELIEPGKEKAYLTGTAVRVASNYRRSYSRKRDISDTDAAEAAIDPSGDPETLLQHRRERALLDRVLDALPDDLKVVLALSELEELSNPEVAALLELPVGTVASRLRRARISFRQIAEAFRIEYEAEHE